jgi:hypothetical protein
MKKESDPPLAYFPLILIFSYALVFAILFNHLMPAARGRILMPLLPLVIFTITIWYDKIIKQLMGKYALVGFISLFLILFLLNPKVMPGNKIYKSQYRLVYDILKDHVNSGNKLLIAPVSIYSFDRGYQSDLYFGKNAIYLVHLPIKNEYSLESLKKLLQNMNIRYIFLGRRIDRRLLNPDFPLSGPHRGWLRNEKIPYSLEKDREIIQAYIRSKGGLIINENRFGEIYYLCDGEEESGLIPNGSFEHWWNRFPIGKWRLVNGRISQSEEATDGSSSIRFETDDNEGSRIIWDFGDLFKEEVKLRVRCDVKEGKSCKFCLFFTAGINGKRQIIKPGMVRYTGKGDWMSIGNDFKITPGMKGIFFHLRLFPGARAPAFVDNLSIELLKE